MVKKIYVDICGDLFHPGHINFFKKCLKLYPDAELMVGILSDNQVASYKRVPMLTTEERKTMIESCKYVNEVFVAPPIPVTEDFINEHKIDMVMHANDMSEKELNYWYADAKKLGKFRVVEYTRGISTTELIMRIKSR